jgi:uncharacterized protein (TIGR02453 family)
MRFKGWPAEAIEFFEGLEADNSRAYWEAHKASYERHVREPMESLVAELSPEFGDGRIYRPYRDVRFSKDKSPYKTNIAASFAEGGYVSLSAQGLGAGSGMYMMAPDQIERYRKAVDEDGSGKDLERLVQVLRSKGIDTRSHDALKTAPKGYAKDHPRIELLRYKDLVAWQQWSVGRWLGTAEVKKRLVGFFAECKPLNDWLGENVGPSELPVAAGGGRRH